MHYLLIDVKHLRGERVFERPSDGAPRHSLRVFNNMETRNSRNRAPGGVGATLWRNWTCFALLEDPITQRICFTYTVAHKAGASHHWYLWIREALGDTVIFVATLKTETARKAPTISPSGALGSSHKFVTVKAIMEPMFLASCWRTIGKIC